MRLAWHQTVLAGGRELGGVIIACALIPGGGFGAYAADRAATVVKFRILSRDQIDRYLKAEKPYQCAGSFKSETRGISLFEYIEGDDPTALIGLPLIRLSGMLNEVGFCIP